MSGNGVDPLDAAIAAAAQSVTLRQIKVTISSTGRPAMVAIPVDATDAELAEVAGWLLTVVLGAYRAERVKAGPRLIVPPGALVSHG